MKPQAADRPFSLRKGAMWVALSAAALLVLVGGCGQFNDDPYQSGLTLRYEFAGASSATSGTSSRMYTWDVGLMGQEVKSIVIGAIVVSRATPYSGVADIVDSNNSDQLLDDATQSAQYLEFVEMSEINADGDLISFPIPPDNAGNWQLAAVGLKNGGYTFLTDIQDDDPIWYGFVGTFLNGLVQDGGELGNTLLLEPWCDSTAAPAHPSCP